MSPPVLSHRVWHVWGRNKDVFMKTYRTNFIPALMQPILYLLAFGFGLGIFIEEIDGISYIQFIAPAIVAISVMSTAFYECSYGSFIRMHYQKTFEAIISTPLNIEEVITGEILWGATKSLIDSTIILLVIAAFGLIQSIQALLIIPLAFAGGLLFASLAMFFTAIMPNIDSFNFPIFLFITPMTFLSGTFFPLSILPGALQTLSYLLPLTPIAYITRGAMLGTLGADLGILVYCIAFIILVAAFFFTIALRLMKRRLID